MAGISTLYRTIRGKFKEAPRKRLEKRVAYLADLLVAFTDVGKKVNINRAVKLKEYEALLDRQAEEREEFACQAIQSDIDILEAEAKVNNIKI